MTLSTIQPIGKSPYAAPYAAAPAAMPAGMPKMNMAMASDVASPSSAALCAFTRKMPSVPRSTTTGQRRTHAWTASHCSAGHRFEAT